jgi:hypothetical protein
VNSNQNKPDQAPVSNWQKTSHPNTGAPRCDKKQQQTKTTKHTIEFSNNTPALPREQGNPTSLSRRIYPSQIASSRII